MTSEGRVRRKGVSTAFGEVCHVQRPLDTV